VNMEFNVQPGSLVMGLHFDLGRVLPAPLGFREAGFIGPSPMSAPLPPLPPLERSAEPGAGDSLPTHSFEQLGRRILAASSGGRGLSDDVRNRLEDHLGADLSNVKLHSDGEADHLARSVNAVAFTTGQDIFLRAGAYNPDSPEGMRLLAHEIVHTQQQASGPVAGTPIPGGVAVSHPADPFEREAERLADRVGRLPDRSSESQPRHSKSHSKQPPSIQTAQPQMESHSETPQQTSLINVQRDDGAGGAGAATAAPSATGSSSAAPTSPGSGDVMRRIIFGETVLKDVKPLSSGAANQLAKSIAHSPVYAMMRERDEKHARLNSLIQEVKMVEGVQSTTDREQEINQLAAHVEQLNTAIQGALSAMNLTEENIVAEVQAFVEIWLERGKQIAYTMLDKSLETVQEEQARYVIEETVPEDIGGLKLADQHLAEIALDIQGQPALEELKRLQDEMGHTENFEGTDFHQMFVATQQRKLELQAELRPKYEALKVQVREYGSKYRVIFDPNYVPGSFQTMTDEEVSEETGKWLEELGEKIENTRGRIGDEVKVWDLQDIPDPAFRSLNIPANSMLGDAVRDHITKEKSDADALKDALMIIGIGFGLLAVVATGGAALAFGAVAVGASAGASMISLIDDLERYVVQSDAQGIMLDPELNEIFSQGDPQLVSILLDIVALGLSMFAASRLVKPIRGAIQEFLAVREAEKATEALEKFVAKAMNAGLTESQARALAARVMDPTRALSSSGMAGSLANREGCGVFLRNIPGASEPVAVKVYPQSMEKMFQLDMEGARAAAATGKGPRFFGEVPAEAGKKAFAVEHVIGGFSDEMALGSATQAELAVATEEAAFYASKISRQTLADVDDYARRLVEQGHFYDGEVQGLVTPKGNWVPIDTQPIRPLPPLSDAAARAEALRINAVNFQNERDALISTGAKNGIQFKLIVGAADDPYEREADGVADAVINSHEVNPPAQNVPEISAGGGTGCSACAGGQPCSECGAKSVVSPDASTKEGLVQTKLHNHTVSPSPSTLTSIGNASSGSPLPSGVRDRVEPVLGVDLSHVQVHTDSAAQASANQLKAKAFTHQNHIWLGSHQSADDLPLMAHELAHVVQQRRGQPRHDIQRKTAEERIDDHTSWGDLNEDALGRELAALLPGNEFEVRTVLQALGSTDRDDVASSIAQASSDEVLKSSGPEFITYLGEQLARGWTSDEESGVIGRLNRLKAQISTTVAPLPGSVEARVLEFRQTVADMAVGRLTQNIRAIDAWKTFLENSLPLEELRPQTTAREASRLYRNVSHAQSRGLGGTEANLYEQWAGTRNPYMREVQEHQIRGEWRACTGCHMTTRANAMPEETGSINWMTPSEQLAGYAGTRGTSSRFSTTLSSGDVANITRFVQGLPNASGSVTSSSSTVSPSSTPSTPSSTSSTSPTTSSTSTSTSAATPSPTNANDASGYFGSGGFDPTRYPATASIMESVTRIRPFLDQLGPDGYEVLPPETINSNAPPAELLADISAHIEQRKSDYQELIDKIRGGQIDPMTFQPIVAWLLPLADADVFQALGDERDSEERWAIVKAIVIGVTVIALLIISIAFPPAAILAAGITAGEVVAVGTLGLSLWQLASGAEDLQRGYELNQNISLATGTNDLFYPEQQRHADALMMIGVINIALSALGLRGSLASLGQLARLETTAGSRLLSIGSSGRLTPYAGQTIQRGPWTMTISDDGVMAVMRHVEDDGLLAIADAEGIGLYRLLPNGERFTIGYQPFSSAGGAAATAESAWTETIVIPNQMLLPAGEASGTSLVTTAEPTMSMASQTPLLLSAPNMSLGGRLSYQSLAWIEAKYGVAVRNSVAAARRQQDWDTIGLTLGGRRREFLADVTELASVDIRGATGSHFTARPHSGGTVSGPDVFSVTAEGPAHLTVVEAKAGMSANPYQVGASGLGVSYGNTPRLYEAILRFIRDRSQPIRMRARVKLALDEGSISWTVDAYGNVRITARGPNAMPGDVPVNRPVQVGRE